MAGIPDVDAHKVYIGQENPKLDRSDKTKNGDKPFDGTLAVTGPAFIGNHSKKAKGVTNLGKDLGDFKASVPNRALDIEGDVGIEGDTDQIGQHTSTKNIITKAHFIGDITQTSGTPPGCKVFDLPHPNIDGYRLRHACVEGPEAAIYVR